MTTLTPTLTLADPRDA